MAIAPAHKCGINTVNATSNNAFIYEIKFDRRRGAIDIVDKHDRRTSQPLEVFQKLLAKLMCCTLQDNGLLDIGTRLHHNLFQLRCLNSRARDQICIWWNWLEVLSDKSWNGRWSLRSCFIGRVSRKFHVHVCKRQQFPEEILEMKVYSKQLLNNRKRVREYIPRCKTVLLTADAIKGSEFSSSSFWWNFDLIKVFCTFFFEPVHRACSSRFWIFTLNDMLVEVASPLVRTRSLSSCRRFAGTVFIPGRGSSILSRSADFHQSRAIFKKCITYLDNKTGPLVGICSLLNGPLSESIEAYNGTDQSSRLMLATIQVTTLMLSVTGASEAEDILSRVSNGMAYNHGVLTYR